VNIYNDTGAASVRAEFSPLERALNYPKSRPAGGGFALLPARCPAGSEKPDVLVMAE
jgi:hypothetical protein